MPPTPVQMPTEASFPNNMLSCKSPSSLMPPQSHKLAQSRCAYPSYSFNRTANIFFPYNSHLSFLLSHSLEHKVQKSTTGSQEHPKPPHIISSRLTQRPLLQQILHLYRSLYFGRCLRSSSRTRRKRVQRRSR
jgi:hypothetical protein